MKPNEILRCDTDFCILSKLICYIEYGYKDDIFVSVTKTGELFIDIHNLYRLRGCLRFLINQKQTSSTIKMLLRDLENKIKHIRDIEKLLNETVEIKNIDLDKLRNRL